MIICGVDPGLITSGYAVLVATGETFAIRDAGICRTDTSAPLADRLAQIDHDFSEIFEQFKPTAVGVEELYAHYKHPRTAILMGHARGVILAAAARENVTTYNFAATRVKRYLTGNGHATKAQMQRAIMTTFNLNTPPEPADVADALAIALCCAQEMRHPSKEILRA